MIVLPPLARLQGIRHAFFTRTGGVSGGVYASRNVGYGSGDDRANVDRNRALCRADLGADALVTVHQVHSPDAVVVSEPWQPESAPRADGMATDRPGVALGVLTADCAPLLMADAERGVIGAAHAGWRGALGGVIEATLDAMSGLGAAPDRIVAAIGPCIARDSYEVGPEFRDRFAEAGGDNDRFFTPSPRPGHFLFDLPGYVAARLRRLGVAEVHQSGHDTAADAERFYSYRRSVLRGEPDYGRLLSAIVLDPGPG